MNNLAFRRVGTTTDTKVYYAISNDEKMQFNIAETPPDRVFAVVTSLQERGKVLALKTDFKTVEEAKAWCESFS